MATYSASVLTGAGTATLPMCALVGNGTIRALIREIGVFNTTATAVDVSLVRLSTAGTPGSNATTQSEGAGTAAATAILKGTYTGSAPTTIIAGRRAQLGAAIGSGVIWTFPGNGLVIDNVANAAVGLILGTGTGQACVCSFAWEE
jgi:hypothetical protein